MKEQTFFEHLEELRKRLFVCLAALLVSAAAGFFLADRALSLLVLPVQGQIERLYFFSPQEAFLVKLKTALFVAALIASPIWIGQLWGFLSPAFYETEKRRALPVVAVISLLFIFGVAFSYAFVLPFALKFLLGAQTDFFTPMIGMSQYLGFVTGMLVSFGIAFTLPVFVVAAVWAGILKSSWLVKHQRHALLAILVIAAVLTPGPDVLSMLMLAGPLFFLFEVSVLISHFIEMGRLQKKEVVE